MKNQFILVILAAILTSCGEPSKKAITPVSTTEYAILTEDLSNDTIIQKDSLSIDFQIRSFLYAASSPKNAEKPNGEYRSGNFPKKVDSTFAKGNLFLMISEKEHSIVGNKYLGHKLYLVNSTNEAIDFFAQDSKLSIKIEALNKRGTWKPISYMPTSTCGNSYHTITLDSNEYWEFNIPVFTGDYKTKIRYALSLDKETKLVSNEIVAYINAGQLDKSKKQGSTSVNLMNPYND